MQQFLEINSIPEYKYGFFRYFFKGEHHITRVSEEDVLLIVFSGILRFEENGKPVDVAAGEYYIQKKGLLQTGNRVSESPKYFYIHFIGNYNDTNGIALKGTADINSLMPTLEKLSKAEAKSLGKIEIYENFLRVLNSLYSLNTKDIEVSAAQKAAEYIGLHKSEKLKISDVAAQLGYTDDYLIRTFRKHYGITPYDYLMNLRISDAKQLMLTTNRSVAMIATECGFSDVTSFYKAFIQRNGTTPAKWKKDNQNKKA
jgi:AraC-like DNA-binding protein